MDRPKNSTLCALKINDNRSAYGLLQAIRWRQQSCTVDASCSPYEGKTGAKLVCARVASVSERTVKRSRSKRKRFGAERIPPYRAGSSNIGRVSEICEMAETTWLRAAQAGSSLPMAISTYAPPTSTFCARWMTVEVPSRAMTS